MELVKRAIRDVPDFPKPGILFKDITPVVLDPTVFKATVDAFADRYRGMGIDRIAAIESRGFVFGCALGYILGVGVALVRKPGKLPAETIEESYDLEYGSNTLQIHRDAIRPGERVLVIDDLLATGGTASATGALVRRLGGEVSEYAFVVELSFLNGRERLGETPVYALLVY